MTFSVRRDSPLESGLVRRLTTLVAIALAVGCARTLPEQDRRILSAVAVMKLPVEDLWKEYQQNAADANSRYWGKAIEVSGKVAGKVTGVAASKTASQILFGPVPDAQVRANLLDDQAAELLSLAVEGQRIRLKCYCDGFKGAVILKSCVKP